MIELSGLELFLIIAIAVMGTSMFFFARQLSNLIETTKPRYNSKDGQEIIEAYETPKFSAGSLLALNDLERNLLAELGKVQAKKSHVLEELQRELTIAQSISMTGATRGKSEK